MNSSAGGNSFGLSGSRGLRSKFALPFGSPLNDRLEIRRPPTARAIPHSAFRIPHLSPRRCGALLLEVILALTILFMGMAVIGIQLRTSIATGHENERMTQALMLAEAKLGQLDAGAINLDREMSSDGVLEGDFGKSFPGYFFRFTIEPHDDLEDIFEVTTEILSGPHEDDLEPGDIQDAEVMLTLYSFRPTPATLNLQRDFGVSDEQMDEVAASLPPDLDPTDLSPAAFAEMDLEELLELMPQFLEIFGQGFGISLDQIQQAMDMGLLDLTNLPTGAESFDKGQSQGSQGRGDRTEPGGGRPRPRGERQDREDRQPRPGSRVGGGEPR